MGAQESYLGKRGDEAAFAALLKQHREFYLVITLTPCMPSAAFLKSVDAHLPRMEVPIVCARESSLSIFRAACASQEHKDLVTELWEYASRPTVGFPAVFKISRDGSFEYQRNRDAIFNSASDE